MKQDSQKEMSKEMFDNDGSFHSSSRFATFTGGNRDGCRHFQRKLALARLQVMILVRHIKARTDLLRVQVPMTHNQGVGISPAKLFQQVAKAMRWASVRVSAGFPSLDSPPM